MSLFIQNVFDVVDEHALGRCGFNDENQLVRVQEGTPATRVIINRPSWLTPAQAARHLMWLAQEIEAGRIDV
jgi:hypothetical protein